MELFPPIESRESGWLPVGDGHEIHWELSGNPTGPVVLFVHGGPGAGTQPAYRRFFDPGFWRILLVDQRGCGQSRPAASVEANTTADLIADFERLRRHLGIERWLLFGGSWGSTLALAYGQAHPTRCLGFVLRGVFLFSAAEIDWFLTGMGRFFPEAGRRFATFLPPEEREEGLTAWRRRLNHPDPAIHLPAARAWCAYEEACARLLPLAEEPGPVGPSGLALARIEAHYMAHQGFLAPGQLLNGMAAIRHLPAIIVQGRYDVICPPHTAFALARAWPGALLRMVPDAGHAAMEPPLRAALVEAVERIKAAVTGG
ncbi:prolyl aminopeptidase [Phaeospirillum tilakii]|uniref:Proline iminopeptidase n=1 Tax=Phaeospirillum tilakii TaxID=741673 RepID=A0ABW5CFH4_9PROT